MLSIATHANCGPSPGEYTFVHSQSYTESATVSMTKSEHWEINAGVEIKGGVKIKEVFTAERTYSFLLKRSFLYS